METDETTRHKQEVEAAMAQIQAFNQRRRRGWRLEIPVWKLAIEGTCSFLLAFLMGMGFAVLFGIFAH
ncbi:MAG: hypothetical protein LBP75_09565 [Planctomycetota bacterium]|jgi:hypothetical protein|nr:hypothetical protein [Planctomycetota bacterium]